MTTLSAGSAAAWMFWLASDQPEGDSIGGRRPGGRERPDPVLMRGRRVPLSDAEAIALAMHVRGGDEAAFRTLYLAFFRPLCEFAYTLVGSADVAEDVVQDVFAQWWERRESVVITKGVDPYLYSGVRHRALNHRRATHLHSGDAVIATITCEGAGMATREIAPDEHTQLHEFERALATAIAALPPTRRAVLMLRVRHDLDYATIADVMGISAEAAMIHVSRARTALRKVLERFYEIP